MQNLLFPQYQLIKESRAVVFHFLESEVGNDISLPVASFNDKTLRYMLIHVANTYIAWINNFALGGTMAYFDDEAVSDIPQIREIFLLVDGFMATFSTKYAQNPTLPISGYKWVDKYIETDSYSIFTHVITHEFHHKGQSMTMSRLLGHIPPDTDVMRF